MITRKTKFGLMSRDVTTNYIKYSNKQFANWST